jgi:molybdenum cofactor guanylyltransferase
MRRSKSVILMNISAVLLAGGESRRMGKDKATIFFRQRPLWQNQIDLLRALQPKEIFVSARTNPPWRPRGVQFVSDEPPSRGPLSGLSATLARISTDHLLAFAIDLPLMTEKYLRGICNLIEPGRGVLPMMGNRAEPLVAIYPKSTAADFITALSGSDFSLQSLTKKLVQAGKLSPLKILEEERNLFRNLNNFSDLE